MLLPAQKAQMRLGVHRDFLANEKARATAPISYPGYLKFPVASYSRIESVPLIEGHNSEIGDCVPTACCNIVQTTLGMSGNFNSLGNDLPWQIYSSVTGYNPNNPASDQGTDPDAMLQWWQNNQIGPYKLSKYSRLNPQDEITMRAAVSITGAILLIANLAVEQQNQSEWNDTGTPGTWGLHAICLDQFSGPDWWVTTWGERQPIDWSFFSSGRVTAAYSLGFTS